MKAMNMAEAAATCQRNKIDEAKITIKCNTTIMYNVWGGCDAMIKDG
jgi:hypothetical protein